MKTLFAITLITMILTALFFAYMVQNVRAAGVLHFATLSMLAMAVIIELKTLGNQLDRK